MNRNKNNDIYRSMKIYLNEDSLFKGEKLYNALVNQLKKLEIQNVIVTHGIDGYLNTPFRTSGDNELIPNMPVIVEAIDQSWRISNVIWKIDEMVNDCLVIVSDVVIVNFKNKVNTN